MSLFSWLQTRTSNSPARTPSQRRPAVRRFSPRLEALEGRALPTAFVAATAADLIADINAANQAGGANTITLSAPTTSPYVLTAVNNSTDGATGTPVISGGAKHLAADNLTIVGNGDAIERGTNTPFRLFDVAAGGSLTLENLTLGNGLAYGAGSAAQGGAVRNQGNLLLNQVTVDRNEAFGLFYQTKKGSSSGDAAGGGIWSSGALTVENQSVFQFNTVIGAGTGSGYGGGIAIAGGIADIDSSTIGSFSPAAEYGGNSALGGYQNGTYAPNGPGAGYGGGIYVGSGTVTLTNDVIDGNSAGSFINELFEGFDNLGYGGGIYVASGASVYLDTFTLNSTNNNTGLPPSATTDIYGQYTLLA